MSTKIQINSVAAIERLIGNDNETELEIRKSVVAEFCARHLSKLVPEIMAKHAGDIEKRVREAMLMAQGEIVHYNHSGGRYELSDAFKMELNQRVRSTVLDAINQASRESAKAALPALDAQVGQIIERQLKGLVQTKLAKVVAAEVSEADLGALMTAAVRERLSKK